VRSYYKDTSGEWRLVLYFGANYKTFRIKQLCKTGKKFIEILPFVYLLFTFPHYLLIMKIPYGMPKGIFIGEEIYSAGDTLSTQLNF